MLEHLIDINDSLQKYGCCDMLEVIVDNPMLLQAKLQLGEVIVLVNDISIVKIN